MNVLTSAVAPARRTRLRPVVLVRALAKHIWRTRGAQMRRRMSWFFAAFVALLAIREYYALGIVWSPSIAPSVVVVGKRAPAEIGRLVAYRYPGRPLGDFRRGDDMIHWVIAGEGSVISVVGRDVFVDGKPVGRAKETTYRFEPLTPAAPGVIPKNYFFVTGTHPDALDSRYAEAGLVHRNDVVGRAWAVF